MNKILFIFSIYLFSINISIANKSNTMEIVKLKVNIQPTERSRAGNKGLPSNVQSSNQEKQSLTISRPNGLDLTSVENSNVCSNADPSKQNDEGVDSGTTTIEHYNIYGNKSGTCKPSKSNQKIINQASQTQATEVNKNDCSIKEYYRQRPSLLAANIDAVEHYNSQGKKEGLCRPVELLASTRKAISNSPVIVPKNIKPNNGIPTNPNPIIHYLDEALGKEIKWDRGWDTQIGHRTKIDPEVKLEYGQLRGSNNQTFFGDIKYNSVSISHWGLQQYFTTTDKLHAKVVLLIDKGSYLHGGAFEWSRDQQNYVGLANITVEKNSDMQTWHQRWLPPMKGEKVWYFLMSDDEEWSSNPISFIWP